MNPVTIANNAPSYPTTFSWLDESVRAGKEYTYKVEMTYSDGTSLVWYEAATARAEAPLAFALRVMVPNPFQIAGDSWKIAFDVPAPGSYVSIALYDVRGRQLITLLEGYAEPGTFASAISGPDLERLGPGVYFLRMEAEPFRESKKVILMR